jgi:hypothetical protein
MAAMISYGPSLLLAARSTIDANYSAVAKLISGMGFRSEECPKGLD